MEQPSKQKPGFYIVATPIGNPNDITLRALEVLKNADIIACEDTRVTNKLLSYHGIKASMMCYNDHSSEHEREKILRYLAEGKIVALVSDAGTPLISDPGYKLVLEVREQGYPITSLPGASSVLTALTLAGLPTNRFLFEGFLPPKSAARKKQLESLKELEATLVFFEAARRLQEALVDMEAVLGNRKCSVLRELTKHYEEVKQGSLSELISYYQMAGEPKGEVVVVVEPATKTECDAEELDDLLQKALSTMKLKEAVEHVTSLSRLPRKQVYTRALELKK